MSSSQSYHVPSAEDLSSRSVEVCTLGSSDPIYIWQAEHDLRVSFRLEPGAELEGFASKGGVYVHWASAIELDWLDLDRFETVPRSSDPAEEYAFRANLQLLGASWWPTIHDNLVADFWTWMEDGGQAGQREELRFIGVTPEGGDWVLADTGDSLLKGAGRIENVANMAKNFPEHGSKHPTNSSEVPSSRLSPNFPTETAT
ncbi:hypothetical protein VTI74DRAFT_6455 [Chaetomium olivicolor]